MCGGYPGFNFFPCRAQVCLLRCSLLSSLLLLLLRIHETEQNSYCQQIITERHLAELEELVSGAVRWDGGSFGARRAQISFCLVLKEMGRLSVPLVK